MKKEKQVVSARIDKHLLDEARKSGLDLPALFEAAIAKIIKEEKCPYCGAYKHDKRHKDTQ